MRRAEAPLSLLLLSVLSCGGAEMEEAREPTAVRTIVAEEGAVGRIACVPFVLSGSDGAVLTAPSPSTVTAVHVSEGDSVSAGDPLLSLESDAALTAGVSAADARVSSARASLNLARTELARSEALLASGATTAADHEQAVAREAAAEAALGAAIAARSSAGSEAEAGLLAAPFSGTVIRVSVSEGDPADGELVAISGGGQLEAELLLPPYCAGVASQGMPVFLSTPHRPGETFEGVVVSASPVVDPVSGLVACTAVFPDDEGSLRPGMSGTASVAVSTDSGQVVLPLRAIDATGDGQRTVTLKRDGRAVTAEVTLGAREGFRWQVTSGVVPGDSVVLLGGDIAPEGGELREAGR